MRRAWLTLLAATGVTVAAVIPAAAPASAAALAPPQIRVNQVGYPSSGPKAAYVMLPRKVASVLMRALVMRRSSGWDITGSLK